MSTATSDPTIQAPLGPADASRPTATVSLNEIDAMCRKAARGAGYDWGLAEEAGRAVRWLSAWNLPGPETLLATLVAIDGRSRAHAPVAQRHDRHDAERSGDMQHWRAAEGFLCPVATGAALSDHAGYLQRGVEIVLAGIRCPLLLLPFLHRAASDLDCRFSVSAPGLVIVAGADGPSTEASRLPDRLDELRVRCTSADDDVTIDPGDATGPNDATADCRTLSTGVWRALDRYAMRTCVPSSEASRAGAGAGVSDND